jgi:hypothetical protein
MSAALDRKLKTVKKVPASEPAQGAEVEDVEIDFGVMDERPPLIEEGLYEVGYVRSGQKFWSFDHYSVASYFKITTPGPHEGKELFMVYRVSPREGRKGMAFSSKIVEMVTLALGRQPNRKDRLTSSVFHGKRFKALVRTVKLNAKKKKRAECAQYSIIDTLLEKVAG